jgi:integrase/recombinase XerD
MTPSKMKKMLARFLIAKEAAGRSRRTIDWYEDLNLQFIESLPNNFPDTKLPELIELYQKKRRGLGLSASTISAQYRAIKVWLRWCFMRELLDRDPMKGIEAPAIPDSKPQHVTPDQYFRLIDWMNHQIRRDGHWLDYRDKLIFEMLFMTGIRIAEMVNIRNKHIDLKMRILHIVAGKGDKARDVPISEDLATSLVEYINVRPGWRGDELLISANGHAIVRGIFTIDGVRQMMKRRMKEAGVPYMSPHKFRHAFGMWTLNNHIDPTIVSKTMGHVDVDFTMKFYARWLNGSLQEAYDKGLKKLEEKHNR